MAQCLSSRILAPSFSWVCVCYPAHNHSKAGPMIVNALWAWKSPQSGLFIVKIVPVRNLFSLQCWITRSTDWVRWSKHATLNIFPCPFWQQLSVSQASTTTEKPIVVLAVEVPWTSRTRNCRIECWAPVRSWMVEQRFDSCLSSPRPPPPTGSSEGN